MADEIAIEDLKTPAEVAKIMGVTRMTVYRHIKEGKLEGIPIAGVMFVHYPTGKR